MDIEMQSTTTRPIPNAKAMEAGNMVEVDPKLFVTCRLCLDDMGVYQIVPAIQQQIKYCFDIDVDPFDGLPQLLCKKCESLLCDYFKAKKYFSEKQKSLIMMKQDLKTVQFVQPQQDTVSSSQQTNGDNKSKSDNIPIKKTKRKRVISTTDSESDDANINSVITEVHTSSVTEFKRSKCTSWESDYNKLFVCKLCNGYYKRKNGLSSHLRTHRSLMTKYQNILKTNCTVDLTRIDYKANITGDVNKVVHSSQKITQEGDSYYYVIYIPKVSLNGAAVNLSEIICSNKPSNFSSSDEGRNNKRQISTESSGDESTTLSQQRRKRNRRLSSTSSNETVVIGNKSIRSDPSSEVDDLKIKTFFADNGAQNYIDCIDIEDSSDSSSNKNTSGAKLGTTNRKPIKVKHLESKAIHNIISLCQKKYMKRKEASDSDTQNKKSIKNCLKYKVLSIGRKIVNKRGFNCNGLLKYMESRNLELKWLPRTQQNASKDANYIQINVKHKTGEENDNGFNKSEWKIVTPIPLENEQEDTNPVEHTSGIVENNNSPADITLQCTVQPVESNSVGLVPEANNAESKNKLLNENPVANPKHFPKKGNLVTSKQNVSNIIPDDLASVTENNDSGLCLPIITSTKSLAVTEPTEQSIGKNTIMAGPRIKVKPVTELLSERILYSILHSQTNSQIAKQCPTTQTQNISQSVQEVETGSSLRTSVRMDNESSSVQREYVILDTVEFPNTKTDSPFGYFKNLLQIHNIVLLDTDYLLPRDFTCLIKFKVLYKQETKDQPVILCLSLFCLKNMFCLKVKDRNQENINMAKISANWQWELLKIYKGDVVNKLLQNALKVSQEVHEHTKTFLCLLESIIYKTDT